MAIMSNSAEGADCACNSAQSARLMPVPAVSRSMPTVDRAVRLELRSMTIRRPARTQASARRYIQRLEANEFLLLREVRASKPMMKGGKPVAARKTGLGMLAA